ncbi:MAG: helix-turn-helix transcriptional regulator [Atribacterota bacterium]|nr:helix-turn-helix transcriptional regulator [Atribacterota bacterium]
MKFGTTIKTLRKHKGIKQKELALKLGISNAYLSSIENNKKEPSLELIKALAIHLEIPVGYFFVEAYDTELLTGKQRKVFDKVKKLLAEFLRLQGKDERKI